MTQAYEEAVKDEAVVARAKRMCIADCEDRKVGDHSCCDSWDAFVLRAKRALDGEKADGGSS